MKGVDPVNRGEYCDSVNWDILYKQFLFLTLFNEIEINVFMLISFCCFAWCKLSTIYFIYIYIYIIY